MLHGGGGSDRLIGDDHENADGGNDTLSGGGGDDEFYFVTANFGNDVISNYNLYSREKIYLCQGAVRNPILATHSGANSGSDYIITVTHGSATAGTITLRE